MKNLTATQKNKLNKMYFVTHWTHYLIRLYEYRNLQLSKAEMGFIMFITQNDSDILMEHVTSTFRIDGNVSKITMKRRRCKCVSII